MTIRFQFELIVMPTERNDTWRDYFMCLSNSLRIRDRSDVIVRSSERYPVNLEDGSSDPLI